MDRQISMNLSENFTLEELIFSQTALRKNIPNNPNASQIDNLQELCIKVLQPIRSYFKKPLIISSGFRSAELCIAIGSKITSQHTEGKASDFKVSSLTNTEVADWIINNISSYDQLILEFGDDGWIHISYNGADNRNQNLKAFKEETKTKYIPY